MYSDEASDEAEDTINVAPIDLTTSSDSLPPRGRRARARLETVDSSDEAPDPRKPLNSPTTLSSLTVNLQPPQARRIQTTLQKGSEPFLLSLPRYIQPAAKDSSQCPPRGTLQRPGW